MGWWVGWSLCACGQADCSGLCASSRMKGEEGVRDSGRACAWLCLLELNKWVLRLWDPGVDGCEME